MNGTYNIKLVEVTRTGAMTMKRLFRLMAVAGLAAMAFAAPASANLVANGGFEADPDGIAFFEWTFTEPVGVVNFAQLSGAPVNTGNWALWWGPFGGTATMTQNVATVAGAEYTFDFYFRGDVIPAEGEGQSFQAFWDGAAIPLDGIEFTVLTEDTPFQHFSFQGTASSASTEIKFVAQNDPTFFYLDDISVNAVGAVPEPAGLALLLGIAVSGLVFIRRREHK
jgi:hypothetical protein